MRSKSPIIFCILTAMVLVFSSSASISSVELSSASAETETLQTRPRFFSRYTSLTGRGCGSGMTKAEERAAEEQGSDLPTRCKGPGGYEILVGYSACAAQISAEKGSDSFPLIMQAGNFKQNVVEWRMVQSYGKTFPFAVIMREYDYAGDDICATGGKITAEYLVVKGLEGNEHIDEKIDVRKTPNPNVKARQIADKKFGMSL